VSLFVDQATTYNDCPQCEAKAGWPCIPEKRQLPFYTHAVRMIAEHHRRAAERQHDTAERGQA